MATPSTVAPAVSGAPSPVITTGNAISADNLGKGAAPLTVPPATPTITNTPTVTAPTGTTTSTTGVATIPTGSSTDTQSYIRSQLGVLGNELGTKGAAETALQNSTDLADKTTQATNDYNTYNQAKLNLAQAVEKMQNENPTGEFGGARAAEIAKFQREGNANLANLAVIAQSSQGLLSAAQKTIDDKISAQFQPITDQIDFLTKFANVNNNDLTDSQKTQITANVDKVKTESAAVQTAASDIHQTLLKNGAPASAYSKVDQITNQYLAGNLSASEAQSQMYAAISGYSGTSSGLTKSEIQNGAVNAGLTSSDFSNLNSDVQTYFTKASQSQIDAWNGTGGILTNVKSGSLSPDDAAKQINAANIAQPVKDYMLQQIKTNTPATGSGGGLWNSIVNFFKSGGTGGGNTTTAQTTVMTDSSGKQWNIPNDKVDVARSNGLK